MSTAFVENQTLSTETCIKCGVLFALPKQWQDEFRKTHQQFYCPAGHPQYYPGETTEEALRKSVARLETTIEHKDAALTSVREQRDTAERRRRAMKGVHTRTCNRIKHGVCPCCNRTFQNLAMHMKSEHPAFKAEEPKT